MSLITGELHIKFCRKYCSTVELLQDSLGRNIDIPDRKSEAKDPFSNGVTYKQNPCTQPYNTNDMYMIYKIYIFNFTLKFMPSA